MSHIIGRGRYARETYPQSRGGGGAAACLAPLHRTIYVDGNTAIPLADRNGSISCPYGTIQAALDTIPAPPDLSDALDLSQPFVLLVASGNYFEDVVLPVNGYSVHIQAIGGSGPAETFDPFLLGSAAWGPSVFVTEFLLAPSGPAWDDDPGAVIAPTYQFESIVSNVFDLDATAIVGEELMNNTTLIFRRSSFEELVDVGEDPDKWQSIINIRESTFAFISTKDVAYIAEHSLLGFVECLAMRSADSVIDDIELFGTTTFPEFAFNDTVITTSLATFFGDIVFLDGVTSYYAEKNSAISVFESREVSEDNSNAFLHASRNLLPLGGGITTFRDGDTFISANATGVGGARRVILPSIASVTIGGTSNLLAGQRIVASDTASIGSVLPEPAFPDVIRGGNPVLGPGESAVFVPIDASTWVVVATNP